MRRGEGRAGGPVGAHAGALHSSHTPHTHTFSLNRPALSSTMTEGKIGELGEGEREKERGRSGGARPDHSLAANRGESECARARVRPPALAPCRPHRAHTLHSTPVTWLKSPGDKVKKVRFVSFNGWRGGAGEQAKREEQKAAPAPGPAPIERARRSLRRPPGPAHALCTRSPQKHPQSPALDPDRRPGLEDAGSAGWSLALGARRATPCRCPPLVSPAGLAPSPPSLTALFSLSLS